MKIVYYLHGLKWKEGEVSLEDMEKGYIPFSIWQELNSESDYIEVKKIFFKIKEDNWERIPLNRLSCREQNIITMRLSEGVTDLKYDERTIKSVNLHEEYFVIRNVRAECSNPHVCINDEEKLSWKDIELDDSLICLAKNKNSIFDVIDLE